MNVVKTTRAATTLDDVYHIKNQAYIPTSEDDESLDT